MLDRLRASNLISSRGLGGLLVFIGLVMFLAVFLVAFPVLSDPVGTYDEWFPESDEPAEVADPEVEEESFEGPVAVFRYVAESTMIEPEEGSEEEPTFSYVVEFEDRSELGDADIESWIWDLGDGAEASRRSFRHTYAEPGSYPVRLEVEDSNGETSKVEGDVEVPEEGGSSGRMEAEESLDLSGIESAVEDAVGTLETSVDDALDSAGTAARNTAIVLLFALAAIATTVIAWRVTRSGIMLLQPDQQVRMKVKSADMRVEVGKVPLEEAVAELPPEDRELVEV